MENGKVPGMDLGLSLKEPHLTKTVSSNYISGYPAILLRTVKELGCGQLNFSKMDLH